MSIEKETELKQRVFTVQEVARMCGNVHPSSIYRAVEAGQLLPLKGFGVLRFSDIELERFFRNSGAKPKKRVKRKLA
jgi:hypothetical protein